MALSLEDTLNFGKYKGKTILQIYQENPSYLVWLRNERFTQNGERSYFSPEINVLLDDVIANSSKLRNTYKKWGDTIRGIPASKTTEEEVLATEFSNDALGARYESTWGAF